MSRSPPVHSSDHHNRSGRRESDGGNADNHHEGHLDNNRTGQIQIHPVSVQVPLHEQYYSPNFDNHVCYDPYSPSPITENVYTATSPPYCPTCAISPPPPPPVDRISLLQDEFLLHILSFMPSMKNVIATSILSKRWRFLWTLSPNFVFSNMRDGDDFRNCVNRTLTLCGGTKINKFIVDYHFSSRHGADVDTWVRFAIRNKAEELGLHFIDAYRSWSKINGRHRYKLPHHLYWYSRITKLSVSHCIVLPTGGIGWKNLKSLSIGQTELSNNVIEIVLAGSPVLESLELFKFCGIDCLDLGSSLITNLVVRDYHNGNDHFSNRNNPAESRSFKISGGPNLRSLEIIGSFYRKEILVVSVASLNQVNLNYNLAPNNNDAGEMQYINDHQYRTSIKEVLESLHHVDNLQIGLWPLKAIGTFEKAGYSSTPLCNCKCLTLSTLFKKPEDLYGTIMLLASTMELQTLVVNLEPDAHEYREYLHANDSDRHNTCQQMRDSQLLCPNLRIVKIVNFTEGPFITELLQFLLTNAKILEKIIICGPKRREISWKELFRASQKLLRLPRASASPHVVIDFSE